MIEPRKVGTALYRRSIRINVLAGQNGYGQPLSDDADDADEQPGFFSIFSSCSKKPRSSSARSARSEELLKATPSPRKVAPREWRRRHATTDSALQRQTDPRGGAA